MKRGRVTALFITASLLLAGCSGRDGQENITSAPVPVKAARPQPFSAGYALAYSGTIEAGESIPLSFATVGNVARVLVAEGDAVRKGQLLAELNAESSRNAWEMSQAALNQAEDAWSRLKPMYESGSLPEIKWIEIETNLQKARSAAAISKKNLEDCRLISPVSGIVGRRAIDPGMGAMPNLASITIVRIDRVFAKVAVPENEIARVARGEQARLRISALEGAEYAGRVEEVGVVADPLAHSYAVRIAVENPGHRIKPGMICSAVLEDSSRSRGLVLPAGAVLVDEKGINYLYVVNAESLAQRREVTIGALLQEGIEILSGLEPDELVVLAGQHKLGTGKPVRVVTN